MQVVIEISENDYELACRWPDALTTVYAHAIKNGTPLPKWHGDLIDRNKIVFDYWSVAGYTCVSRENIFSMPVVVPADKDGD